ncbi:UNVERIFIED_CONTAM: hypothetical protein K2H54_053430 [Gekko kuhli]
MQIGVRRLAQHRRENRSHLSRMRITADKKTLKTKMAYPTRGVLWLGEEVECMIQTLLDQEAGPRVMTSTHLETQGLFEEVASAMRAHGYRRTGAQVRAKFKREKVAFFDALEDWHGLPPPPGPPRARRVLPTEQAAGAAVEEAGPAQGAHDPVVVVSSPEGSPAPQSGQEEEGEEAILLSSPHDSEEEEVQQPDLAAVMQVVEERLRTMEAGMVNIRRTLNRHSYRLGFIQRGMVRQRNMLQRSMRPRQHRAVRRRAQQLGLVE